MANKQIQNIYELYKIQEEYNKLKNTFNGVKEMKDTKVITVICADT